MRPVARELEKRLGQPYLSVLYEQTTFDIRRKVGHEVTDRDFYFVHEAIRERMVNDAE